VVVVVVVVLLLLLLLLGVMLCTMNRQGKGWGAEGELMHCNDGGCDCTIRSDVSQSLINNDHCRTQTRTVQCTTD
jgi:hypothetical protein